jgi:hypothetical protein
MPTARHLQAMASSTATGNTTRPPPSPRQDFDSAALQVIAPALSRMRIDYVRGNTIDGLHMHV